MKDDDEICLCFHVTKRKVVQYIRVERPKIASQLSNCYGAGTGCGWCRPFLRRLLEQTDPAMTALPNAETYADQRQRYQKETQKD